MPQNQTKQIDERDLSVVEVAAILVLRRNWFLFSFLIFLTVAVIFSVTREKQSQYVSIYQMPTKGGHELLVPAQTVATNLETTLLSAVQASAVEDNARELLDIKVVYSQDSFSIQVQSRAIPSEQRRVEEEHRLLLQELDKWLSDTFRKAQERMKIKLSGLDQAIEFLKDQEDNGQALAALMDKRIELEAEIDSMVAGSILTVAQVDKKEVGVSSKLLIVLSVVFSVFFAAIFSFIIEFFSRVRTEVARTRSEITNGSQE